MTVPNFIPEIHRTQDAQEIQIVESKVNLGLITEIDPRDIPTGAVQVANNCFCRFDKIGRRVGTILLDPSKPNNQPVTRLAFFETADGSPYTVRLTPSSLHTLTISGWNSLAISPALTGGVTDRFNVIDVLDSFIFTNNGANPPQLANFNSGSVGILGNWNDIYEANPRFCIGFFNRAVFFALKDSAEATVAWSADGTPTQFDGTVDNTAGSAPIIESPADQSDFITGALAFTNVAIVFREHSIWLATKQPIPTDPFYFFSTVPGIGCDCSFSIQLIGNGAVWVDARRRKVYAYVPGSIPTEIQGNIRTQLFNDIVDTSQVFSGYNSLQSEYMLFVPVAGNVTRCYVYNFDAKAWTIREYYGLTAADDFDVATASITIDELIGPIDGLTGTIDELSKVGSISSAFAYGRNDGTILLEDATVDTDAPHTDFPGGITYQTQIQSKLYQVPNTNFILSRINISYQCSRTTTLVLEYSRDNGSTWVVGKTINPTVFNRPINLRFKKNVRCTNITWRLTYSSSDLEILGYEMYAYPSGETETGE